MKKLLSTFVLLFIVSCAGGEDPVEGPAPKTSPVPEVATDPYSFIDAGVISSNKQTSCSVGTETKCWGAGSDGQIGNGLTENSVEIPATVSGGHNFKSVSVGVGHTCAVDSVNDAYCWGNNEFNQLGSVGADSPTPILAMEDVRQISAGYQTTCAISIQDELYCWGDGADGKNGLDGEQADSPTKIDIVGETFSKLTQNANRTFCAITHGEKLYCWGDDMNGQVGNEYPKADVMSPEPVAPGLSFKFVSNSSYHTCAITTDNDLYCWGDNAYGQLMGGEVGTDSSEPLDTGIKATGLIVGNHRTCYTDTEFKTFCAGSNANGVLGTGDEEDLLSPTLISSQYKPVGMKGPSFSLFSNHSGQIFGTGMNGLGSLADETGTPSAFLDFTRVSDLVISQ